MCKNLSFLFVSICLLLITLPLYAESKSNKIHIFVTIPPHAFFVEKIAGPNASVNVLVPQGQSPHSYEPSPKQMAGLADADIYFRAGINIENALMPKLDSINKDLKIVDLRKGIGLIKNDPHIWLSPKLAIIQAKTIADALCEIDPKSCSEYNKNLESLLLDLRKLNEKLTLLFKPFKGKSLYVFHPAFGYFANAYGLKQIAVEVEGKEPSARKLALLIDNAKKDGVKILFVEPQSSAKSTKVIADAIGASIVTIDPLAENYIKNMEDIADKIEKSLK